MTSKTAQVIQDDIEGAKREARLAQVEVIRQLADELEADPSIDMLAWRLKRSFTEQGSYETEHFATRLVSYTSVVGRKKMLELLIGLNPKDMPPLWRLVLLRFGIRTGCFRKSGRD